MDLWSLSLNTREIRAGPSVLERPRFKAVPKASECELLGDPRLYCPRGIEAVGSLAYKPARGANLQATRWRIRERVYGRAPGDVLLPVPPWSDLLIPECASPPALEFPGSYGVTADIRLIVRPKKRLRLLGHASSVDEQGCRSGKPRAVQTLTTPIAGELKAFAGTRRD